GGPAQVVAPSPGMPQTLRLPGGMEDRGAHSLHQRAHQQSPEDRKPTDGAVASPADSADDRNPLLHPTDLSPRKPLLQVDTDQHCGPEPALMAILEASGRTWGGGFCPQLSRPRWLVSRRDTPHHTGVCVLGAPGLPEPAGRPCPAVPLGPTDAAVATASRPEPSFPALCAASLPRASVPGEARPRPGEKDLAQGTWDPSGEEALRLGSVIGRVRSHKGVVDGFREWGRWRAGWAFLAINIHVKGRDKESEVQIQATLVRSPGARESAEVPQRMPGAPGRAGPPEPRALWLGREEL
ncbi:unnamed protein product, partial [Rangifer tarandus platyrhynchus]